MRPGLGTTAWTANLSLFSATQRLLGGYNISVSMSFYGLIALAILAYAVTRFWNSCERDSLASEQGFMIGLALLLPPFLEEHHLVLLLFPILLLFAGLKEANRTCRVLLMAGYLLLAVRYSLARFPKFHSGYLSLFSNGKLYGLILILLAVLLLWRALCHRAGGQKKEIAT